MSNEYDADGLLRLLGADNEEYQSAYADMRAESFVEPTYSAVYLDVGDKDGQSRIGIMNSYKIERGNEEIDVRGLDGSFTAHRGREITAIQISLIDPDVKVIRKAMTSGKAAKIFMLIGGNSAWGGVVVKHTSDIVTSGDETSVDVTMEVIGKMHTTDPKEPDRALAYARAAHFGQKRKYDGRDYIVHPMSVAHIVQIFGGSQNMITAAYLHDVVEDTDKTQEDIEREFSPEAAAIVKWLTDVPLEDGNRKRRKMLDRERLSLAPQAAKTVKLADIIDNATSIKANDPQFWTLFRSECIELLEALRGGNVKLWEMAHKILTEE